MTDSADWETIAIGLLIRSGGRCEIRSPVCLGGVRGDLSVARRSIHHRRPRGKGGSRRDDVDTYANLMVVCGDGVTGCHGYAESHRTWAFERGILVPNNGDQDATDPAQIALVLHSGRRVALTPDHPFYLPPLDGPAYIEHMPIPA